MKEILIERFGNTYCFLVDDEDYPLLSRHKWSVLPSNKRVYAYAHIGIDTRHHKMIPMTHIIMGSGLCVDHIDGNFLNNQKSNLRVATKQQNNWNTPKMQIRGGKKTSSQYKGVHRLKKTGKWRANIKHNGKLHSLGEFVTELEAALAYNKAAKSLKGDWAWLNPVPETSF